VFTIAVNGPASDVPELGERVVRHDDRVDPASDRLTRALHRCRRRDVGRRHERHRDASALALVPRAARMTAHHFAS
jgi:hypothetical protein